MRAKRAHYSDDGQPFINSNLFAFDEARRKHRTCAFRALREFELDRDRVVETARQRILVVGQTAVEEERSRGPERCSQPMDRCEVRDQRAHGTADQDVPYESAEVHGT